MDIPEDLAADLQALGYLGSPDDTAYTTTLFRRPLRRFDADGYGLVGHEAEIPSYSGSLDLGGSDFPQEQLLFGWRPAGAEGRHVMANEAAVRLARGSGQGEWRLHGKAVSSPDGEVIVLEARIDGGESRSFRLPSGQEFLVRGDLPSSEEDTARLDFRCRREPASADGIQRRAGCALVTQVEMLPASGVRNPALPSN